MFGLSEDLPNSPAHWPLVDVYAHNCQKTWLKFLHRHNFGKKGAWIYLTSLLFQAVLINPVGLNQPSLSGTVKTAQALAIPQQCVTLCGCSPILGCTAEKLEEESRHAEQQLSSNMTLLWSDEDEDITVVRPSSQPCFTKLLQSFPPSHVSTGGFSKPGLSRWDACPPARRTVHYPQPPAWSFCRTITNNLRVPQHPVWGDIKFLLLLISLIVSGRLSLSTEQGQNFTAAKETISRQGTASKAPECAGSSTVHYYWGVPFCPRGLDPDSYTRVKIYKIKGASVIIQVHLFTENFLLALFCVSQVILAQMEVYEKSLKQAQRGLLRKAEWGEAILPQPEVPQTIYNWLRLCNSQLF